MKTNEDVDGRSGDGVCHSYTSNGRPADTKQPTLDSVSVERLMASNSDGERPAACMCMSGVRTGTSMDSDGLTWANDL